jgi:hypothetical protein
VQGEIEVHQGSSPAGALVTLVRSEANGRFSVRLSRGTYFLVGRTVKPNAVGCYGDKPVAVASAPISVDVVCVAK